VCGGGSLQVFSGHGPTKGGAQHREDKGKSEQPHLDMCRWEVIAPTSRVLVFKAPTPAASPRACKKRSWCCSEPRTQLKQRRKRLAYTHTRERGARAGRKENHFCGRSQSLETDWSLL